MDARDNFLYLTDIKNVSTGFENRILSFLFHSENYDILPKNGVWLANKICKS